MADTTKWGPKPAWWDDAVKHLHQVDPVLRPILDRFPTEYLRPRDDAFYTLVRAVVGQQISVTAAQSIWERLEKLLGTVDVAHVAASDEDALRSAGLSRSKARYLLGFAREGSWFVDHPWDQEDDATAIKRMCALKGVGPWTAEMFLIFHLIRPDILPLKDIGLVRAIERNYAQCARLSDEEVEAIAEAWRPYRTAATWFLWRNLDPLPVEY